MNLESHIMIFFTSLKVLSNVSLYVSSGFICIYSVPLGYAYDSFRAKSSSRKVHPMDQISILDLVPETTNKGYEQFHIVC